MSLFLMGFHRYFLQCGYWHGFMLTLALEFIFLPLMMAFHKNQRQSIESEISGGWPWEEPSYSKEGGSCGWPGLGILQSHWFQGNRICWLAESELAAVTLIFHPGRQCHTSSCLAVNQDRQFLQLNPLPAWIFPPDTAGIYHIQSAFHQTTF